MPRGDGTGPRGQGPGKGRGTGGRQGGGRGGGENYPGEWHVLRDTLKGED